MATLAERVRLGEEGVAEVEVASLLEDFALATTAKDVSLMLTMLPCRQASHGPTQPQPLAGSRDGTVGREVGEEGLGLGLAALDLAARPERRWGWRYKLTVCDLDPKPTTANLRKYVELDAQIRAAAQEVDVGGSGAVATARQGWGLGGCVGRGCVPA